MIQNTQDILANAEEYAKIKKIFDLHNNDMVLAVVDKGKVTLYTDRFQEVVSKTVAVSGGRIINITRKEFVEAAVPKTKDEIVDAVENLYEKPVEITAEAENTEGETTENPFADTVEETEEPKTKKRK
jgi:hypothetical protein